MTHEERKLENDRHYVAQWLLEAKRRIYATSLSAVSAFHAGSWDEMASRQAQESRDERTRKQYSSVHDFLMKKLYSKNKSITNMLVLK
ncbi:hypothetical protein LCGC14_0347580 [marine sediment metagenome]|uniref:Uncharacterized protein n=1 Tax=marine sediment metagenome TaxID=412755 RepID=A0A0F9VZ66_9ZZZZ